MARTSEEIRLRNLANAKASYWRRKKPCPKCGVLIAPDAQHCRKCRPRKLTATKINSGRAYAQAHFELATWCERCQTARAVDRHHIDGDTFNNTPENIASPLPAMSHGD